MKSSVRGAFAMVSLCFLASGAAGLIYQVVWARYLALFLGHSSYAIVAVLVAFMGGLALGNAWFGPIADRVRQPLACYAWLEIGIGVYAIIFPVYFSFCQEAFVGLARSLHPGSTALLALKFLFSFLLVLLPTVLMGATFPVLTRFVTRTLSELRERVAALYAINSTGAILGVLIADYWWIPALGLEVTVYGAAALNLVVGLVTFVLSLRLDERSLTVEAAKPDRSEAKERYSPGELRLAVAAIGVSGFVAMLYEVAWTRLLSLVLGSSTHAFSLMLITFIGGIAVGAWVVYRWKPLRRMLEAFGWAELALGLALFASMFFYQYLPFWFIRLAGLLARSDEAYPFYELLQALVCFAVMFGPAVCLGMTLPLISRVATVELARTGRSVGKVFAVNTLGTVLGTILTGLWLMPALGLARTFAVGVGLNAMIGLAALTWNRAPKRWLALALPALGGVGLFWFAGAKLDPIWQRAFSLGLWRSQDPPRTLSDFRQMVAETAMLYHKDGAGSTVDVYSWSEAGREYLTLKVNGKADAGTESDMVTQSLLGHVPMLLRPQAKRALVVGLGSGVTCSAIARHPGIERVDVVEISPEVIESAKYFAPFNDRILENPKLHVAVEDAKSFLKITGRTYDLIVSEPSNPWMAGVAGVFSREYYEDCAARLEPGGLIAQWMHVYETSDETVDLVLRTFASVFPWLSIWQPGPGDLILVGATRPVKPDLEAMERRFAELAVQSDLARVDLLTLPVVLARQIVPQQNGFFIIPPEGPVHSDSYPALEYLAERSFFVKRSSERWRQYQENASPRAIGLLGQFLRRHPLTEADFTAFTRAYLKHGLPEPPLFRSLLHRWQADSTKPAFPLNLWAQAPDGMAAAEARVLRFAPLRETVMQEAASNPEPLRQYAADLLATYRSQRSVFYLPSSAELETVLGRLMETDSRYQRLYKLQLAELAWDRGDDARCVELGQAALDPEPSGGGPVDFSRDPTAPRLVLYLMIESLWRAGQVADAWALCRQAKLHGYLENSRAHFPLLEVSYRRVEAYVKEASGVQSNPAPVGLGAGN